jgi:hypothetical protein
MANGLKEFLKSGVKNNSLKNKKSNYIVEFFNLFHTTTNGIRGLHHILTQVTIYIYLIN